MNTKFQIHRNNKLDKVYFLKAHTRAAMAAIGEGSKKSGSVMLDVFNEVCVSLDKERGLTQ